LYEDHEDADQVSEREETLDDDTKSAETGASMKHFSTHDLSRANELLVKQKVKLGLTQKIEK